VDRLRRGVEAVALRPRSANAVTACSAISCRRTPEPRPAVLAVQNVIKCGPPTARFRRRAWFEKRM